MVTTLTPTLPDSRAGGRIGGAPPVAIESHPVLTTHRYLLTLPADCAPWTGGREVSVLLREGFDIVDDDLAYPDMAMRAVLHRPSSRGSRPELGWPGLRSASLTECGDDIVPFVRIGTEPVLIQNDPTYADAVLADGHDFLFQVDEEGWPVAAELEDMVGSYLWGYGSVYFYGTLREDGTVDEVVAGFIDF
ncbi:hypothetical protein ACN261_04315 [Micromonospora sp. WMMD723]|uniref:hypothetical protein n=1 Tax=unclassified Micromonospora TaxID=2617518 RepID=UPI003B960E84